MTDWLWCIGSALWLGVLTAISPCPLATNIAAMSYIGRRVDHPALVFWTGLCYTLGRTVTYLGLGILLVFSLLSIPHLSFFLQKYMNQILGPLLILTGMLLLEMISLPIGESRLQTWIGKWTERQGLWGAGALGMVFALSFCPISAALFFGALIPLAVQHQSGFLLPFVYGVGTALPVVLFALLIAWGAHFLNPIFQQMTLVERWGRTITGGVFILLGGYYCLTQNLGLFF